MASTALRGSELTSIARRHGQRRYARFAEHHTSCSYAGRLGRAAFPPRCSMEPSSDWRMYCSPTKWWVGIARVSPTQRSKRSPARACGYPTVRCSRAASDAVAEAGCLAPDVARLLKSRNQADEENRTGTAWFCFFPPGRAGEDGIGRFFRHWGGEALYNSHERDPVSSQAISCIGTPCLVEANVPIAALARHCGLEFNILRRFLVGRGLPGQGSADYEDASCVRCQLQMFGASFAFLVRTSLN